MVDEQHQFFSLVHTVFENVLQKSQATMISIIKVVKYHIEFIRQNT